MRSSDTAKQPMDPNHLDTQAFRQALGSFTTGVTIITTRDSDGNPVGLTVNSFNSVSMEPPMVLWSLANEALSLPIFRNASRWAVHVLSSDQAELSTRFAKRGEDKFIGVGLEQGIAGIPLLTGCSARFQCQTAFQYEGGDHVIFVGKVLSFDKSEAAPLVFHGGSYAHTTRRDDKRDPRRPQLDGSFNENFLGYLLGRAHFLLYHYIQPMLDAERLSDEEFYVLSVLTLKRRMTPADLDTGMNGVLGEKNKKALDALIERGYVYSDNDTEGTTVFELTDSGIASALRLISAAKEAESKVLAHLGYEDSTILKSLLKRVLEAIDPGAAALWEDDSE